MTQDDLAKKVDKRATAQLVSRWERGIVSPSHRNLRRLRQVLPGAFSQPETSSLAVDSTAASAGDAT